MWIYFIIKIVDLLDTVSLPMFYSIPKWVIIFDIFFIKVIFALRKKDTQISFLHVFHHFSMVANAWSGVYYVAGGQSNFPTNIIEKI